MSLYFPPAEILNYYDSRRFLEVISDTGVEEFIGTYLGSPIYLQAVRSAEAELDEILQVGAHYDKQTLLDACTAADTPAPMGATADQLVQLELAKRRVAPLREMLAHLIFGKLMSRRGFSADTMRQLAPMYESALERLEKLAGGSRVFDFAANIGSGVPLRVEIGLGLPTGKSFNAMFGVWGGQDGGLSGDSLYPGNW